MRAAYAPAGLVWTAPLGFDNTFALVVRPDAGRAHDLRRRRAGAAAGRRPSATSSSSARRLPRRSPASTASRSRDVRTMDLGLLYRALVDRQVDLVVGSATDGADRHARLRRPRRRPACVPALRGGAGRPAGRARSLPRAARRRSTALGGTLDRRHDAPPEPGGRRRSPRRRRTWCATCERESSERVSVAFRGY